MQLRYCRGSVRHRWEGPWVWLELAYREGRGLFSTRIVAPCLQDGGVGMQILHLQVQNISQSNPNTSSAASPEYNCNVFCSHHVNLPNPNPNAQGTGGMGGLGAMIPQAQPEP